MTRSIGGVTDESQIILDAPGRFAMTRRGRESTWRPAGEVKMALRGGKIPRADRFSAEQHVARFFEEHFLEFECFFESVDPHSVWPGPHGSHFSIFCRSCAKSRQKPPPGPQKRTPNPRKSVRGRSWKRIFADRKIRTRA